MAVQGGQALIKLKKEKGGIFGQLLEFTVSLNINVRMRKMCWLQSKREKNERGVAEIRLVF